MIKKSFLFFLIFVSFLSLGNTIKKTETRNSKVLLTAAIIDKHFELRKVEYVKSIEVIKQLGYEPYIVEACISGPSFLDQYCCHVFYPNVNVPHIDKGINEAISMLKALNHFGFDDNDMIIKVTGRYCFIDDSFVQFVECNSNLDAVVMKWPHFREGDLFTGCFAMKCKYFKDMLIDYLRVTIRGLYKRRAHPIIESWLSLYVYIMKKKYCRVAYVEKVGLQTNIFSNGAQYDPNNFKIY